MDLLPTVCREFRLPLPDGLDGVDIASQTEETEAAQAQAEAEAELAQKKKNHAKDVARAKEKAANEAARAQEKAAQEVARAEAEAAKQQAALFKQQSAAEDELRAIASERAQQQLRRHGRP